MAGSDLVAVVFVGVNGGTNASVSGVTFGGAAMTQIGSAVYNGSTTDEKIYAFYLLNPAPGAKNIAIAASNASLYLFAGAVFESVDQVAPLSAASTDNTSPLAVAPTGVAGGFPLIGATYWRTSGGAPSFASGAGQTRLQAKTSSEYGIALDTEDAIAGAQSLSYTLTGPVYAAEAIGVVLLPAH